MEFPAISPFEFGNHLRGAGFYFLTVVLRGKVGFPFLLNK